MYSRVFMVNCEFTFFDLRGCVLNERDHRNVDTVDATMEAVREQMELTNEISEAISNPVGMGIDVSFSCSNVYLVLDLTLCSL